VVARDKVSLDITWLKDDSETDAASLPDPDTLIAEIIEELTAAAEELAAATSPQRSPAFE
jgi:type I restriction enzyme M protein